MEQLELPQPVSTDFDGRDTFDRSLDGERLRNQLERVFRLVRDGEWRTLDEIALVTHDPPASISARLRDLRKQRYGAFLVDRRRRGDEADGTFEYRIRAKHSGAASAS